MSAKKSRHVATAAALALLGSITAAGAAAASDFTLDFDAGLACAFPLRVEGTVGNTIVREFTDENGHVVRTLSTGTGSALTFTNLESQATVSLRSNGAVSRSTTLADGSTRTVTGGHNVLILFPTDVPAGPSTVLYTGQTVYTVDPTGVFTLLKASGTSRDLCAELSG